LLSRPSTEIGPTPTTLVMVSKAGLLLSKVYLPDGVDRDPARDDRRPGSYVGPLAARSPESRDVTTGGVRRFVVAMSRISTRHGGDGRGMGPTLQVRQSALVSEGRTFRYKGASRLEGRDSSLAT
jgi:hypothetical protein